MFGSRQPRGWARPALVLFSVLALLAFVFSPAVLQAETVYTPEQTTIPGQTKPGHQSKNSSSENPEAQTSGSGVVNQGGSGGSSGGGASSGQGGSPGGEGGSNQGHSGKGSAEGKNPAGPGKGSVEAAPTTSDDDGSSPLVPILIAILVLAAISIAAVVARKRRGMGDPVSPKAN